MFLQSHSNLFYMLDNQQYYNYTKIYICSLPMTNESRKVLNHLVLLRQTRPLFSWWKYRQCLLLCLARNFTLYQMYNASILFAIVSHSIIVHPRKKEDFLLSCPPQILFEKQPFDRFWRFLFSERWARITLWRLNTQWNGKEIHRSQCRNDTIACRPKYKTGLAK